MKKDIPLKSKEAINKIAKNEIRRFKNTIEHNKKAKTNEETLYQYTEYSTKKLNKENRKKCTDAMREIFRNTQDSLRDVILKYESLDNTTNHEETNTEVGASMFIFNCEKS